MCIVNDEEKIVYSRQITLPEVGEKGQEELEDTGILIVGMGGLGGFWSAFWSRAGGGGHVV